MSFESSLRKDDLHDFYVKKREFFRDNQNFIRNMSNSKQSDDKFSETSEIIFVGKSNVGKSTLINLLFNTELAKVSKIPVSQGK